jgi:hypothetical protein
MGLGLTIEGVVDCDVPLRLLHSTMSGLPADALCSLRTFDDAKIDVAMPSASHQPCESFPVPNAHLPHRHTWCYTSRTQCDANITRN